MTAEYRSVQTRMWREDDWFQSLPTDARLLFIYLFTNPSASIAGIYRLPLRTIEFESGIPQERVKELLAEFSAANKVHYADNVVWVVKMRENQSPGKMSPLVKIRLDKDVASIPDCPLKTRYLEHYRYPIDTLSIPRATETDTETVTETEAPQPTTTADPVPAFTASYKRMWAMLPASEYEQAKVKDWAERVPLEAWEYALKECVDSRNTGQWKYFESILRRVEKDGLQKPKPVSAPTVNGTVPNFDFSQMIGG